MNYYSRREFLIKSSVLGLAAVTGNFLFGLEKEGPTRFDKPLTFQVWGLRETIVKDFYGTLKQVAQIGYKGVEMCSPKGYSEIGFKPLTKYSAKEIHQQIVDAGLYCKSSHFGHWELQGNNADEAINFANTLGLNDIVISPGAANLEDWKKLADDINSTGEFVKKAGMQLAYHNGTMGPVLEGVPLYDHLMNLFDPELVKMQLQIADIDKYDMVEYLTKYKGRYTSVHLLDWDPKINWVTAIGYGMIDWKKLLTAVAKSGISEYGMIIELDCKNPLETLQKSYAYLNNLKV